MVKSYLNNIATISTKIRKSQRKQNKQNINIFIMKGNQISDENLGGEMQEEVESNSKYLERIKSTVHLSNGEMLELIEDQQKFVSKIVMFNQIGVESYQATDFQKSLIYLQQAEKVLQYAASCGKTIERFLIISTLHNEAAVYQKLLQLHKSYDYMQAILFNLKTYFEQNPAVPLTQDLANKQSYQYKLTSANLHRKLSSVVYSLQFAAICSQIDKHPGAIQSAKKALSLISSVIKIYVGFNKVIQRPDIKDKQMKALSKYTAGIDVGEVPYLCKHVRNMVRRARQTNNEDKNYIKLKKFSIGEVMQIQPVSVQESNQFNSLQFLMTSSQITKTALYTSICYYTIATQLRLIAKKDRIQAELTHQYQKSKIFHLFAIKIALEFAPFFSDYHEHIIRSFKTNYHIDLNIELPEYIQQEKIKQSLLDGESFIYKNQLTLSQELQNSIKFDHEQKEKPTRPRRLSSQTLQMSQKVKVPSFKLNIKLKKKKKQSSKQTKDHKNHKESRQKKQRREYLNIFQSKDIGHKDRSDQKKIVYHNSQKKLNMLTCSSRTKLGKPKFGQQQKTRKSTSNEKTKDQTKKNDNQKEKKQKKIMEEYMTMREISGKKNGSNKKPIKKLHTQYSKSKSKSKSKGKKQFLSPKSNTYGFKSFKSS